ncbi:MAG: sensor histidine kinase [Chloroflexi bacterium]|nr:MAG: sensor histidine kinase [Chloroflexota bacterium]
MTGASGQAQDLQKQVQNLQNELNQLRTNNQAIWYLLVQIGNRLQRASTSVKTAVSSLMDYDIFWDETTQYEFLQAIDSSTDELSDLIVLMTLAFRSQAKTLEIETEPNMLQEILVTIQDNFAKNERGVKIAANYPPDGKPILVDYQYLSVALGLLIEAIISEDKEVTQLSLQVTESTTGWQLQIDDLKPSIISIILQLFAQSNDISTIVHQILPENTLKLMTACRILYLQNIELCRQNTAEKNTTLCLSIPIAINLASTQQL